MGLDLVSVAFVGSGQLGHILDPRGKTHVHIEPQTRGYTKENLANKHKKALTPRVFHHRLTIATISQELARA